MSCYLTIMAGYVKGSVFDPGDIIGVYPETYVISKEFYSNPRFKVIKSDMKLEEAQEMLSSDTDLFGGIVKKRNKTVDISTITELSTEKTEPVITKAELLTKISIKSKTVIVQEKTVVVG